MEKQLTAASQPPAEEFLHKLQGSVEARVVCRVWVVVYVLDMYMHISIYMYVCICR